MLWSAETPPSTAGPKRERQRDSLVKQKHSLPNIDCTDIPLQFGLKEISFFCPFACIPIFKKVDGASLQ